ncbi:MAG: hypothetical protein AB1555_05005 [Nitrospirota bacterium]
MSGDVLGFIMDSTIGFIVLATLIVMSASFFSSRTSVKTRAEEKATGTDLSKAA